MADLTEVQKKLVLALQHYSYHGPAHYLVRRYLSYLRPLGRLVESIFLFRISTRLLHGGARIAGNLRH